MKNNYFNWMAVCGTVSVALLSLGLFLGQQAWIAMAGGIVPMVYYHLGYLLPRARKGGLSQAAIDSVYYYGFLVTIAALSLSALVIGMDGAAGQVTTVVYQFGAGLLATAYAVIARMHLSSVATVLDSTSPEAILDRYMKRSLELVDNADSANAKMQAYVASILNRTAEFDTAARTRTERVMMETAGVFAREFKATLDEARAGLAEVRETANDLAMQTARQGLGRNLNDLQTAIQRLTNHFDELSTHSRQSAQGVKDAARSSADLDATLSRLNESIDALTGPQGTLPRSVAALADGSVSLVESTSTLAGAAASLKVAAADIETAGPVFASLGKISKKVQQQLGTLDHVATNLEESLRPLGAASEHVGKLGAGLHELSGTLPSLSQQATSLTGELSRVETAAQRLNGEMNNLAPRHAELTNLGAHVETALQQVAGGVAVVAHQARELSGSGADIAKLVQAVNELATKAASFQTVIGAAEAGLVKFTATTQDTDRTFGASSQALAAAVAATSQSIADDLRRSSQASAMLTERLAQVANNIVDRTRGTTGAAYVRRTDDVFFFTLVDFLLQAFFFGLLLYVLTASRQAEDLRARAPKDAAVEEVIKAAGVSNLTELQDFLTRLQPVDRLRGWAEFFSRNGGAEKVQDAVNAVAMAGGMERVGPAVDIVAQAGGAEKVAASIERLRKIDEGSGKPPCLYDVVDNKRIARTLATVIADDTTIRFKEPTEDLVEVLRMLGTTYSAVETLPLAEFRRVFQPLIQKRPECRYTLGVDEQTELVRARDAVELTFNRKRIKR